MKKQLKTLISLLLIFVLLIACSSKEVISEDKNIQNNSPDVNSEVKITKPVADYITMSYSEYATTNENGEIKTQILSYDTSTKKLEKIFEFDYTAQYPLGYYDKTNQLVYYTQRVGADQEYGDQIFVRDLSSNKSTQLTDNLFAVNYVIPSGDQLFFAANVKGEQVVRLGAINLKTKKMELWGDNDTIIEAITVDHSNKKIYISAYSLKQRNYSLAHQDGPAGQNNFKMPTHTVYETDFDFKEKRKLFSKNYWIRMLMHKEGHVIAFSDKEYNKGQIPSTVIDYDLADRSTDVSQWEAVRLQRGDANYSRDGNKIYAIAIVKNKRGLYEYDVRTKKFTPIFTPEDGFINNIQVVNGS
ncbi:hypothetical protein ACE3NQ_17345 [Paenibacillus terreus]|uniref:TolB protein n=1 Tax=Paenibacillus terreus TaxID=1387834 RepID=A0ABV5BAG5_9BACL